MPINLLNADIAFPNLSTKGKTDEKFREVESYLFMLLEQLRYTLSNLGQENFNQTEVKQFSDGITEPINTRIEKDERNLGKLKEDAEGISIGVQTGDQGGGITLTNPVSGQTSEIILNLGTQSGTGKLQITANDVTIASTGAITFGTSGSSITLREGNTQIAATGAIGIGTNAGKLEITDGGATLATSGTLAISAKSGAIVFSEGGSQICASGQLAISAKTGQIVFSESGTTIASSGTLAISAKTGQIVMSEGGTTIASSGTLSFGTNGSSITLKEGTTQIAATGAIGIGTSNGKLELTDGGATLATSGTLAISAKSGAIVLSEGGSQICSSGALAISAATGSIVMSEGGTTIASSGQLSFGVNGSAITLKEGNTQIAATGAISLSTSGGAFQLKDGNATLATSGVLSISAASGSIVMKEGNTQICSSGALSFGVNGSSITLKEGTTQIAATGAIGIGTSGGKLVITDGGVQLASSGTISFGTSGSSITLMEGTTQIAATGALTLGVQNNEGYSVIQLKDGNTTLATSGNITLGGNVVFVSDLADGTTRISGDNILTGTITGININGGLHASEIRTGISRTDSQMQTAHLYQRAEFTAGGMEFLLVGHRTDAPYTDITYTKQIGEISADANVTRDTDDTLWIRTLTNGQNGVRLKISSSSNVSIDSTAIYKSSAWSDGEIYIGAETYTRSGDSTPHGQMIILGADSGTAIGNTRYSTTYIRGAMKSANLFTSLATDITDMTAHSYTVAGPASGFVIFAYLSGLTRTMSIVIPALSTTLNVTHRVGTDTHYIDFQIAYTAPNTLYGNGTVNITVTGRSNSGNKITHLFRVA